jgi:hypothetical protein
MRRLVDLKMSVEKKNKIDEIIKDLTDVIDMLKCADRWKDQKAVDAWLIKFLDVKDRLNKLTEPEFREAEVRYKKIMEGFQPKKLL